MGSLNLPVDLDKDDIRQQYHAAMTLLNAAITAWPTMTAAQKNTWVGANLDTVLRIERAILVILGKMLG